MLQWIHRVHAHIVIMISVIRVTMALVMIVVEVVDSINQWYNELYNAKFSGRSVAKLRWNVELDEGVDLMVGKRNTRNTHRRQAGQAHKRSQTTRRESRNRNPKAKTTKA